MPRIDRLGIQGFRSFGATAAILDFEAPISVVWGANSEGKTSLAEAVEFLFTGDIARRDLLSSALDEFENALRNAHLPQAADTYVEASITGSDGKKHIIRRTLLEDFTKQKACTSKLELDGVEIDTAALSDIGLDISDPPLGAPVLMQHTLCYLFSTNPKERASYFKSILEVTDLDSVRDALRAIAKEMAPPPNTFRDLVLNIKTAIPALSKALSSLTFETTTTAQIESALSTSAELILSNAGETPATTLVELLSQVEGLTAEKQAQAFPLHGFACRSQTVQWTTFDKSVWNAISDHKVKLQEVDQGTQQLAELFQKVLKIPKVVDSTEDMDCPVCETPRSLTQARIQTIRKHVKDTEEFRIAKSKAKEALGTLKTSLDVLVTAVRTSVPEFLVWDRTRRISERFRTDRIATLLDQTYFSLLRPWLNSVARLMHVKRHILDLCAKSIRNIRDFEEEVARLEDYSPLRERLELLEDSYKRFVVSIEAYKETTDPLIQPLKNLVAKMSATTGWAEFVRLGRSIPELESEVKDAAAHTLLLSELEQACRQVEAAKEAVVEDKFSNLSDEVRSWWNRLRPEEPAFFSDLGLRKKAQRTIDFKAGLAPSIERKNAKLRNAIAVFSQSQMHCLGLATFFARRGEAGGFILLDDPIMAIDDDYSVHFFTCVLRELEQRGVQVIILTYSQKTWTEIQNRYDNRTRVDLKPSSFLLTIRRLVRRS